MTVYNHEWMPFNKPIPGDKRGPRDTGGLATLVQAEKLFQIALLLPCAAFVGWLLGAWADKALHTEWISIAGIALGGIAGLVYVIRLVLSTGNDGGKTGSEL